MISTKSVAFTQGIIMYAKYYNIEGDLTLGGPNTEVVLLGRSGKVCAATFNKKVDWLVEIASETHGKNTKKLIFYYIYILSNDQ